MTRALSRRSYWAGIPLLFVLFIPTARAAEPEIIESTSFTAKDWTRGLHLLAGLGLNAAYFKGPIADGKFGMGLNIYTGVDYYFSDSFAVEIGTEVMFDRIKDILVWDTLGAVGMRIRLPEALGPENTVPFFRFFAGKGPTVYSSSSKDAFAPDLRGDRVQLEGDIYGIAYGMLQHASDGGTWFIEWGARVHHYRKLETIVEVEKVPEVVASRRVRANSVAYSMSLTLGVVVF